MYIQIEEYAHGNTPRMFKLEIGVMHTSGYWYQVIREHSDAENLRTLVKELQEALVEADRKLKLL